MIAPQRDVATITAMLNLVESPDIRQRIEAALKHEQAQQSRVLTSDEAGKMLGRSGRWVFRAAKNGHLRRVHFPGSKIGGGFLQSDVEALLARAVEG